MRNGLFSVLVCSNVICKFKDTALSEFRVTLASVFFFVYFSKCFLLKTIIWRGSEHVDVCQWFSYFFWKFYNFQISRHYAAADRSKGQRVACDLKQKEKMEHKKDGCKQINR